MAEEKQQYRADNYHESFDPSKLKNADLNISQYGDDSSMKNYNDPNRWGGENAKYEGEATKNSQVAYNPNATIEGLDPNYKYGHEAQMANSEEANYIARRNDEIASALYNAGKTSQLDVADFLNSQQGFYNSNSDERHNTVQSIWKRLGQMVEQNKQSDTKSVEPTNTPQDTDNEALSNMESDLNKSTAGELYGKVTAEEGNPQNGIKTQEDANSVYKSMAQSRIDTVKKMQTMSSEAMAYLINEGGNIFSDQSMRDLMQYDSAKYDEIQAELKKIRGQDTINQISTDGKIDMTQSLDASVDNLNSSMNYFIKNTATERDSGQLSQNLNNALSESEIVSSARGQMEVYKRKVQDIQSSIDELPQLANSYFKGDVPQYIINAFISNRMQQYNKELQKYQNLYNATLDEAKWEVSQIQWREEMDYKWANQEADKNYKNANLELNRQELEFNKKKAAISNGQWNKDGSYSYVDIDGVMHTLSKSEAESVLNRDLYDKATSYIDYRSRAIEDAKTAGMELYGDQCEVMSDNYTRQYFGTEMLAEDGSGITDAKRKAQYATEALPQRGFVAVWDYGIVQSNGKNYGHTGIVIDYDPTTGKFTTLESNFKKGKNGQPIVTIEEHSINSASLQGFRDPSKGDPTKKGTGGDYYYYDTPMMSLFNEAYNSVASKDERGAIDLASEAYSIINELDKGGYIDLLVNGEVLDNIMTNIKNRNFVDNDGNLLWDNIKQEAVNSTQDPDVGWAIDRLHRLVEIKLREESGAAINISEWMSNFDMYMPQVGQGSDYKLKRLQSMEQDMVSGLLPTPYKPKYIPIIANNQKVANGTQQIDAITDNILKNN